MCGIVAYVGTQTVVPFLLEGLYTLEYRGYDSAGVAVLEPNEPELAIVKRVGAVSQLDEALQERSLTAQIGIGHTRWATHGAPSEANAHPHFDSDRHVAVVHNGIIENSYELRAELQDKGFHFVSETDTEIIAHLLKSEMLAGKDFKSAFSAALKRLKGSFALAAICKDYPELLCVARNGSPLVLADTPEGVYVASDVLALQKRAHTVLILENQQYGFVEFDMKAAATAAESDAEPKDSFAQMSFYSIIDDSPVDLESRELEGIELQTGCGNYPDFMLKEICEQPEVVARLLSAHLKKDEGHNYQIQLDLLAHDVQAGVAQQATSTQDGAATTNLAARIGVGLSADYLKKLEGIYIVSCGTSHYASQVAKNYLEQYVGIPVTLNVASEFNYQRILLNPRILCVVITQSGETADTLASVRKMKEMGTQVLAITNVVGSSVVRESDAVLYTMAGPEVSVASTKSYTAQVLMMLLFALYLGNLKQNTSQDQINAICTELEKLPAALELVLERADEAAHAKDVVAPEARSALFLGRGANFATASEAALKLKELSYIHAESYPAGEMKHGPIALLEPGFPVVVIAPQDETRSKTLSNIEEMSARGADVIALATDGDSQIEAVSRAVMWLPAIHPELSPFVCVVPLQLFAREIALARGKNVDRPRNLAKSVTVE